MDVQNDFCPGGALGVKGGDEVVPVLNRYIEKFHEEGSLILASRDWHPRKTDHFDTHGGPWPVHCLQQTEGAEFHPDLDLPGEAVIFSKGTTYDADSYSAFLGYNFDKKDLRKYLEQQSIHTLYIGGLATDYCVKFTVLDALKFGFEVFLLTDAVRGVNQSPGDSDHAVKEMVEKGAKPLKFQEFS